MTALTPCFFFFFFNDTATTEIYTLSLHDALPISVPAARFTITAMTSTKPCARRARLRQFPMCWSFPLRIDRKSTRLNSSHGYISYAVFCLKKKKKHSLLNSFTHHHTLTT